MLRHTPLLRAALPALLTILAMPPLVAQKAKPAPGARIAVVAYHDSRLLTVCPILGRNLVYSHLWREGMSARGALFYTYPFIGDTETITGDLGDERPSRLMLPVPASSPLAMGPAVGVLMPSADLDRLAPDGTVQARAEAQFRKLKKFTVVQSPAEADFVFLLESHYIAKIVGSVQRPPEPGNSSIGSGYTVGFRDIESELRRRELSPWDVVAPPPAIYSVVGGDRRLNDRASILGIAVPAAGFLRHQGDGTALAAAKVWEGFVTESQEVKNGRFSLSAASPETLVDRFHGKGPKNPAFLPICAATAGIIGRVDDTVDQPRASRGDPAAEVVAVPAGKAGPTHFRSNVTIVAVPLTVSEDTGRSLFDLPPAMFHVFEDGVEQKVDRVDPGGSPADIAFLIDHSYSMRSVGAAVRGAAGAMAGIPRSADRAMVVSLADRIRVAAELTADRGQIQSAISLLRGRDGTRLHDALTLVTLDRLNASPARKFIVLVSDGVDSRSRLTDATGALSAVESSNVTVYAIRYDTREARPALPPVNQTVDRWIIAPDTAEARGKAYDEADEFLQRLATTTGGRTYFAWPDADLRGILAHIAQQIASQYTLYYYPANDKLDGTYREIKVTVDRPGVTLRARTGYRAGVPQASGGR